MGWGVKGCECARWKRAKERERERGRKCGRGERWQVREGYWKKRRCRAR